MRGRVNKLRLGAQEVGGDAGAELGATEKPEGCSAGSLGSTEASSALSAEAPHPELLQTPLLSLPIKLV